MDLRKLRRQKGWSQEQLAQLSGLNIRTIQRVEKGQQASLETLKCLASVFQLEIDQLTDSSVSQADENSEQELRVKDQVRELKEFYRHVFSYLITLFGLLILNLLTSPGQLWVVWVALGWGIGVIAHGLTTFEKFDFLGADWEKRQIAKRLSKRS